MSDPQIPAVDMRNSTSPAAALAAATSCISTFSLPSSTSAFIGLVSNSLGGFLAEPFPQLGHVQALGLHARAMRIINPLRQRRLFVKWPGAFESLPRATNRPVGASRRALDDRAFGRAVP